MNWTKPIVVLRAEPQEKFFNVSVCRGRDAFVLLVESNDPKWPPFTFELDLNGERAVDPLVIEEDLRYGQRIREYQVEARTASGWKPVASGSPVGRQRIEKFAPVLTANLHFRVAQADAIPLVWLLAAYSVVGARSSSANGK